MVPDRREQAVYETLASRVEELELDHTLEEAVIEHLLDRSRVAFLRAVHSADFIQRIITITPSLTQQQHDELRGIADNLFQLTRQVPREAYDRGTLGDQDTQEPKRKPDVLDGFFREGQAEWEALKQDLASIARRLRR